jgi:hypothetical protein
MAVNSGGLGLVKPSENPARGTTQASSPLAVVALTWAPVSATGHSEQRDRGQGEKEPSEMPSSQLTLSARHRRSPWQQLSERDHEAPCLPIRYCPVMSSGGRVELFQRCLDGAVLATGETIQANGWDPAPGSQAAGEIAAQGPFVRRSKTPVHDAYSFGFARLANATAHVAALSRLLKEEPNVYGAATVARIVLESSAKAAWALDVSLGVKMRVARGRASAIGNVIDVLGFPRPEQPQQEADETDKAFRARVDEFDKIMAEFTKAETTRDDLVADAQAIKLDVKLDRRGRFLGVEEALPGHTETIKIQLGDEGAMAYRDLSGVSHGGMSSLLHRMDEVAAIPGRALMKPTEDVGSHLASLAVAVLAFTRANETRIQLFGWDATKWVAWRLENRDVMRRLFG